MGSLRKGDANKVEGVLPLSEDREFESHEVRGICRQGDLTRQWASKPAR
jgi:hypothetical protein